MFSLRKDFRYACFQGSEGGFCGIAKFRSTNVTVNTKELESEFVSHEMTQVAESKIIAVAAIKYVLGWIVRIHC